jgi:hypothetical protein
LVSAHIDDIRETMSDVTMIITCCSRWDLLERTLDSFFEVNNYPLHHIILHNDGAEVTEKIRDKYQDEIEFLHSKPRIGYSKSLDKLLAKVETRFVFTSEDDWHYHRGGFIDKSKLIMEAHAGVHQVWIRDIKDHNHPVSNIYEILPGLFVHDVKKGYRKIWHGFSLNPGLRRMSDLKQWFPNGLSEFGDEGIISQHLGQPYKAVSLFESAIYHTGWDRRSINFRA